MSTPLPDAVSVLLRTSATAAMGALLLISVSHRELFTWAARMIGGAEPAKEEPRPNGKGPSRERKSTFGQAKPPRNTTSQVKQARKPPSRDAYHQRRRTARDADDQALLQIMRDSPGASIADWAEAIGKSRSSTVSALRRLSDAGLAESVEGRWRLTEPETPKDPPPKWTSPVRGTDRAAHPHLT